MTEMFQRKKQPTTSYSTGITITTEKFWTHLNT